MMKIDDVSNSRCEIISEYKYRSVSEHPRFIRPMVGDSNNTTTVSTLKNNACGKQMLNTNKLSEDSLCSPLADAVYITDSMSSMEGPFSGNWNDRSHVHNGKVQGKATTHADVDYMYSRSAQPGTLYAGKVQDKPISHTDASYLYSRAAQSGIDRETDVNKSASSRTSLQLELSQQGSTFHANSPVDSLKYQGHETRRHNASLEAENNVVCIEDHLGALTTIDEECNGASNDNCRVGMYYDRGRFDLCTGSRSQQNSVHSPAVSRYKRRTMENPDFGRSPNYDIPNSDYHQIMPASSVATESCLISANSPNRSEELFPNIAARGFCCRNGSVDNLVLAPSHLKGEGWRDYSRLLEKHFDIPLHNIDQAGRGKFVYSNIHAISYMDTKSQVATFPPVHSLEQRLNPTISGNRALRVSGSEISLNRLGQIDNSSSYGKSGEQEQRSVRSDIEFDNSGYTNGMSFTQPGHRHVRSSMPDLRYQDNSWLSERDSQFMGHSFHGDRFNHHQQSPQEHYVQLIDYPRFHMSQQLHESSAIVDQCTQTHRSYNPGVTIRECVYSAPLGNPSDSLASLSYQNDQDTIPRQLFHCSRNSPFRAEKTSRISGSSFDLAANNKPSDLRGERHSLDLCNIPQLQKQIRATSELCLQASRRHMFASSADIHKLFSGQIKAPKSVSSSFGKCWDGLQSNRIGLDSPFHRNTNLLSPSPAQEIPRRDQRFTSTPSEIVQSKPLPSQARIDQCSHNRHGASMQQASLSSLLAFENDTSASPALYQPLEIYPEVKRQHVHRKRSSCAEVDREHLLLQRQLSDYSSETELQLIESNAIEVKNMQGTQESERLLDTSAKNFTPIHTSVENHPKAINIHHVTEREPVYANRPVLATSKSDVGNKSCNSGWFRQPGSLPQPCAPSYVNPHFTPSVSEICGSAYANPYFSSIPSSDAFTEHHKQSTNGTTKKSYRFQSSENADFSSSSSSGESGTIWQDSNSSYNSISNSSQMATQNQTSQFPLAATSHSSPVSYKRQHNNIFYTNIPTTLASQTADVNTNNPRFGYQVRQSASSHELSVPYSSRGDFYSPTSYLNTKHSMAGRSHVSSQGIIPDRFLRNGYNTPGRHSDLEGMQKLNLSFDANAVFEDESDRLSTLV